MRERVFKEEMEAKLAEELPGGFPLNQPYTMPARVKRTTGAQSTVPAMKSTGTVGKKSKGMGTVKTKLAKPDIAKPVPPMRRLLAGGLNVKPRMQIAKPPKGGMVRYGSYPTPEQAEEAIFPGRSVTRRLLTKEGQKQRLRDTMSALKDLEATSDEGEKVAALIRLAGLRKEAFLGAALRAGAGVAGRLAKSKLLWGGAGLTGAGIGVQKLISGAKGAVQGSQQRRKKKLPTELQGIYQGVR